MGDHFSLTLVVILMLQAASPQKSSQGIAGASPQGFTARSRTSQHSVAVDVQDDLLKNASKGYSADEDEGDRKYARRGKAHCCVQVLRMIHRNRTRGIAVRKQQLYP